ncbi:MAG: TIGR04282 family arsenosugar biosynthesis glycosyltransferase [Candidatus Omnitrophica bacterium]|nr:TIGR04282 family arsenosugar biosynthesis glycosyltransferase [Candidatus Omnitrophota bacterium]
MRQALLVFMKYPVLGRVKTRIAKVWGDHQAMELHQEFIELTLRNVQSDEWEVLRFVALYGEEEMKPRAESAAFPQQGNDLGERLAHAFKQTFKKRYHRVVAIGSDSPWISIREIGEAFNGLQQNDLVLGPAEDGGYYLIGMSRYLPEVFQGIHWGTPEVFQQTRAIIQQKKLSMAALPIGYDIDTIEDYERFVRESAKREVVPWK